MFTKAMLLGMAMVVFCALTAGASPAERQLSVKEQSTITAGFGGFRCSGPVDCTSPYASYAPAPYYQCLGIIVNLTYSCAPGSQTTCITMAKTWCWRSASKDFVYDPSGCSGLDCHSTSGWTTFEEPNGEASQDCVDH